MNSTKNIHFSLEFISLASGYFVNMLVSLFGIRLLTSLMSPESYGELSLYLTISSFASILFFKPLGQGAFRFFSIAKERNIYNSYEIVLEKLIKSSFIIITTILLLMVFSFMAIGQYQWGLALLLIIPFAFFEGNSSIIVNIQNAARNRIIAAWHGAFDKIFKFGLAALFIHLIIDDSLLAFAGFLLAVVILFISNFFFFKKKLDYLLE